jgi:hypothetical protein
MNKERMLPGRANGSREVSGLRDALQDKPEYQDKMKGLQAQGMT